MRASMIVIGIILLAGAMAVAVLAILEARRASSSNGSGAVDEDPTDLGPAVRK